tara:strand:+ start:230 stop:619 length:390 start_codon:yes stop_codon:yes gene_type:complete
MFAGGLIVSKRTNASMMPDHTKEDITFEPFARPTWWQRIRHKFTNKPVKYLTGSGKAPTDSRDALPQSDGDAFRAPDAGTGLISISPRIPRVLLFIAVLSGALIAGQISTKALANLAHFNAENRGFIHD